MNHVVALSGGKDSTAMALRLAEVEPRDYIYLITPTGDELPEMVDHWNRLENMLGKPMTRVTNQTLDFWIDHFKALPNWRQRWCTRLLKIEPCIAWIKAHQPATLYVGLRADEEERKGIYSEDVISRFPLREWGWDKEQVWDYLMQRGVSIPKRTDCARCYGQRLSEWRQLWRRYPSVYADAEAQELRIGNTFRSPGRDSYPAALVQLRTEFEKEQANADRQGQLFDAGFSDDQGACRVCSL
jgi:3'-phosphoadenosine 5'-phosphosulfate sulfotransferase (PAPS reductase)/FAD synthetase